MAAGGSQPPYPLLEVEISQKANSFTSKPVPRSYSAVVKGQLVNGSTPQSPNSEIKNSSSTPVRTKSVCFPSTQLKPQIEGESQACIQPKISYSEAVKDQFHTGISSEAQLKDNKIQALDIESTALKPTSWYQGKPSVVFSLSEKNILVEKLKFVLIGKFSHGRPSLVKTRAFFAALKLKSSYQFSFLDKKHIFIECSCEADYHYIWLGLIWFIEGLPMRILKWTPDFNPMKESAIVPVWIRIEGLPLYLFDEMSLLSIANSIGKPISIDPRNLSRSIVNSARVCVELDVSQPLLESIWIFFEDDKTKKVLEGFWVKVFYDVVPPFCGFCYHLGHDCNSCKRRAEAPVSATQLDGKHLNEIYNLVANSAQLVGGAVQAAQKNFEPNEASTQVVQQGCRLLQQGQYSTVSSGAGSLLADKTGLEQPQLLQDLGEEEMNAGFGLDNAAEHKECIEDDSLNDMFTDGMAGTTKDGNRIHTECSVLQHATQVILGADTGHVIFTEPTMAIKSEGVGTVIKQTVHGALGDGANFSTEKGIKEVDNMLANNSSVLFAAPVRVDAAVGHDGVAGQELLTGSKETEYKEEGGSWTPKTNKVVQHYTSPSWADWAEEEEETEVNQIVELLTTRNSFAVLNEEVPIEDLTWEEREISVEEEEDNAEQIRIDTTEKEEKEPQFKIVTQLCPLDIQEFAIKEIDNICDTPNKVKPVFEASPIFSNQYILDKDGSPVSCSDVIGKSRRMFKVRNFIDRLKHARGSYRLKNKDSYDQMVSIYTKEMNLAIKEHQQGIYFNHPTKEKAISLVQQTDKLALISGNTRLGKCSDQDAENEDSSQNNIKKCNDFQSHTGTSATPSAEKLVNLRPQTRLSRGRPPGTTNSNKKSDYYYY